MQIFDIDNPPKLSKDLQYNIKLLKQRFGSKFYIVDKNTPIKIPVYLYKVKSANGKNYFYAMIYDIKDRYDKILPFKIDFIDRITNNNNNCYIANIHRTCELTGTQIVIFILKLLKILGADVVSVHDGTEITCAKDNRTTSLSFFKLIEKNMTFYQKFGFKFHIYNSWLKFDYSTDEEMNKAMLKALKQFRKIKISYLINAYTQILNIIKRVIEKQDYNLMKIYLYQPTRPYLVKDLRTYVLRIVNEIDVILRILKQASGTKFLYQLLIQLFYENCADYNNLFTLIINNLIYEIKYHKISIQLKHINLFQTIENIKSNSIYVLKL